MRLLVVSIGAMLTVFGLCSKTCFAKKPPARQYVNVTPMPGSGVALNADGKPDGAGAMQINIPVIYTPGKDYIDISAYAGQWADASTKLTGEASGLWAIPITLLLLRH